MTRKASRRLRTALSAVLIALAFGGCQIASSERHDLKAGWEWYVDSRIASELQGFADPFTGEIWFAEPVDPHAAKVPTTVLARDSERYLDARGIHDAQTCSHYEGLIKRDRWEEQGWFIESLLYSTGSALAAREYSQEFRDSRRENEAWAAAQAVPSSELPDDFEQFRTVRDAEEAQKRARWDDRYSHLDEHFHEVLELRRNLEAEIVTVDNVPKVQDFLVEFCELDLPHDYEHATVDQMGITEVNGRLRTAEP